MQKNSLYIICFCAVGIFAILAYLTSETVVMRGVDKIEIRRAQDNMVQLANYLGSTEIQMHQRVVDWACWDEAYEFMDSPNDDFINNNFDDQFLNDQNISLAAFYRDSTTALRFIDPRAKEHSPELITEEQRALASIAHRLLQNEDVSFKGLMRIGDSVHVIAAHRIYDGNKIKPARGFIVMTRIMDESYVQEVKKITRQTFSVQPVAAYTAPELEDMGNGVRILKTDNAFHTYTLRKDIFGNDICCLELTTSRDIAAVGRQMSLKNFLLMLGLGLTLLIAGFTLLHQREAMVMRNEIAYRESHDSLTGLVNKKRSIPLITTMIQQAHKKHMTIAVLFVDLRRFKGINDSYGHQKGDAILTETARRLSALDYSGIVARAESDKFLLAIEACSQDEVEQCGEDILKALHTPFTIQDTIIHLDANIGIAMAPEHGEDAQTLMQRAELAMYASKKTEKTGITYFTQRMDEEASQRTALENALYRAVDENGLTVFYQPKVDSQRRQVVGFEALIRWQLDGRWIPPGAFIPLAEESNLVTRVDMFVLRAACRQSRLWEQQGFSVPISVNMSARSILQDRFADQVQDILQEESTSPDRIEVEVTETCLMTHLDVATEAIARLAKAGIRIALDDFGTGYSSLLYLHTLPISCLKIDKKFIDDLNASRGSSNDLVKGILALARGLGMTTVAEGVEEREQLQFLEDNGCPVIQGYFFSRPLNAPDCDLYLQTQNQRIDMLLA